MIQCARTDCDQFTAQCRTMRTQDFRTKLEVDWGKNGGKFTAQLLRKPAFSPANHMTSTIQYDATRLRTTSKGLARIHIPGSHIAAGEVLIIQGERCRILERPRPEVYVLDTLPASSARFVIHHEQCSTSATTAINNLLNVWQPVWQRDTEAERDQESEWLQAIQLVEAFAPQLPDIPIPTLTVPAWSDALSRTRNKTSKGSCGFSCPELKSLRKTC